MADAEAISEEVLGQWRNRLSNLYGVLLSVTFALAIEEAALARPAWGAYSKWIGATFAVLIILISGDNWYNYFLTWQSDPQKPFDQRRFFGQSLSTANAPVLPTADGFGILIIREMSIQFCYLFYPFFLVVSVLPSWSPTEVFAANLLIVAVPKPSPWKGDAGIQMKH